MLSPLESYLTDSGPDKILDDGLLRYCNHWLDW